MRLGESKNPKLEKIVLREALDKRGRNIFYMEFHWNGRTPYALLINPNRKYSVHKKVYEGIKRKAQDFGCEFEDRTRYAKKI